MNFIFVCGTMIPEDRNVHLNDTEQQLLDMVNQLLKENQQLEGKLENYVRNE